MSIDLREKKIRVHTPEESEAVQKMLFERGCRWLCSGQELSYIHHPWLFIGCKLQLSYSFDESYGIQHGYEEIQVSELLSKAFDKGMLKTGMLVRTKDNDLRLILGNTAISLNDEGGVGLDDMSMQGKTNRNPYSSYIISEVYSEPKAEGDFLGASMNWWKQADRFLKYSTLLWKYDEPIEEMTMSEVCKALGKNIKIVKDKE